jgi:hypothetical protein
VTVKIAAPLLVCLFEIMAKQLFLCTCQANCGISETLRLKY